MTPFALLLLLAGGPDAKTPPQFGTAGIWIGLQPLEVLRVVW